MTPKEDTAAQPLSLRAYGRRRGTSVEAVRRAIKRGRLKASLVFVNGKPQIGDPDLADREWAENTDLSKAPGYVKERGEQGVTAGRDTPATPPGDGSGALSLTQASASEKAWKAKLAELDYLRKSGELVNAVEVEQRLVDVFARCRTKLLGLPSKAKAALPHLTHGDVLLIDRLIREALEDLSRPAARSLQPGASSGTAA